MIAWWRDLSLGRKLHISIQLTLLALLPLAQVWLVDRLEERMLEDVRQRAEASATQSLLSLNAMMLSGAIINSRLRDAFITKMNKQDGVTDFHVTRSPVVRHQFGEGLSREHAGDELDRQALESGKTEVRSFENGQRTLRVVVPFEAREDFYGTNCMQCHRVEEGTVLGGVSLTLDLEAEYRKLELFSAMLLAGQMALQLLLFLVIGWIIRNVTRSVVELEATMQGVSETGDFSRRAEVRGKDEIGHISQVFNGFLAQIENLYRELAAKVRALEKYHDQTEEELRVGSEIMRRITDAYSTAGHHVRMTVRPATHYSGDLILASRTPDGKMLIFMADAVGHGLIAAINLMPLGQVFNAMSKKGFAVGRIAEEMNVSIHNLLPADRFVSAALVSIDFGERVIEVWNGGAPAPLLLAADGSILKRWESRHVPIGVLGEGEFDAEVDLFQYDCDCQLFLFSDGVLEAESPRGDQFGIAIVESVLGAAQPGERFDALIRSLDEHLGSGRAHDDVSLAMVSIQAGEAPDPIAHSDAMLQRLDSAGQWRMTFSFGAEELKYLDVVQMLTQMVENFRGTERHHAALFTIVSELFNNALDHGVLRLDSEIKKGLDGFESYLEMRERRLRELSRALIEVEFERVEVQGICGVRIVVRDSGAGFDYGRVLSNGMPHGEQHGRGLALVRDMVSRIEFRRGGSEVAVDYACV